MSENNKRDSMVFNKALMEATDNLEPDAYKTIMQILLQYGFEGQVNMQNPFKIAFFKLAKPIIDKDNEG